MATILEELKPSKLNKNNMLISSENVEYIKNYTKDVKDTTKTIKSVNELNMAIKDFEQTAFKISKENRSLKYEIELKNKEIGNLKYDVSKKDKIIDKLLAEKQVLKQQLQKFKNFWHNVIGYFQNKINYGRDTKFIDIAKELFINKIFDGNEYNIVTDRRKKVKTPNELNTIKNSKNKNDIKF